MRINARMHQPVHRHRHHGREVNIMNTRHVNIPVNARTAAGAIRAIRETMERGGRTVISAAVESIEPVRPFANVAISFPRATDCFIISVEYRKDI
jgi:hypothetical protein